MFLPLTPARLYNGIAIAVATDAQWLSLCDVLGRADWGLDDDLRDASSRWARRDELDGLIGEATRDRDAYELMHELQLSGVPAGVVLNGAEMLLDPHLKARRFYETVAHRPSTGMPPLPYAGSPFRMSETPGSIRHPAPLMGQHNRYVLSEVLGRQDVETLEATGVIGNSPVGQRRPTVIPLEEQRRQGRIMDYDPQFKRRVREAYGG